MSGIVAVKTSHHGMRPVSNLKANHARNLKASVPPVLSGGRGCVTLAQAPVIIVSRIHPASNSTRLKPWKIFTFASAMVWLQ